MSYQADLVREIARLSRRLERVESWDLPFYGIGARVYNDAAISVSNAAPQYLTFNSERFDTDAIHSTSTNTGRLTATRGGYYLIIGHVEYAANATGQRHIFIRLGGTTTLARTTVNASSSGVTRLSIATIYPLTAAQYVELGVYQDSTGALNVNTAANLSPEFVIWRLA